ncbi:MAG: hypothetical protein RLZZ142_2703 [Verrucomicrobiota bacterium]
MQVSLRSLCVFGVLIPWLAPLARGAAAGEASGAVPKVQGTAAISGGTLSGGKAGAAKGAVAPKGAVKKPRMVSLLMAEGLRFDPPRFEAKAGEELEIRIENVDPAHLAHNLVVVKPGSVQAVVQEAMGLGEGGPAKAFVPSHPAVLAATTSMVDPEKKLSLRFKVPAESGVYGYVCTVPGHGMVMYGALYVDVPPPPLAKDPNIPQLTLEKGLVGGGKRPFVQRIFMPEAGPAAIAVALPGTQNYCFDAGACRVRYAWAGPFLDGTEHWRGSGNKLAEVGDEAWWKSEGFPLRLGDARKAPEKVKFLGYRLKDGLPEFRYRVGNQEVLQEVLAVDGGVEMVFRLPGWNQNLAFVAEKGAYEWESPQGRFKDGLLELSREQASEFRVRLKRREGASAPKDAKATNPPHGAHP